MKARVTLSNAFMKVHGHDDGMVRQQIVLQLLRQLRGGLRVTDVRRFKDSDEVWVELLFVPFGEERKEGPKFVPLEMFTLPRGDV